MGRLDEALGTLELAVEILEDSAAHALSSRRRRAAARAARNSGRKAEPAKQDDLMDSLFSPEQLTDVKEQLDTAIERLESALETADGSR